jgi:CHAD domain-containing protein
MNVESPFARPGSNRLISLAQYHSRIARFVIRNLIAARDCYSIEGIHDLRVGIKRWRALTVLLQAILPGFDCGNCRKELNKIFKAAGRVRDCHIQQEQIRNSRTNRNWVLSEYYNDLKKTELPVRERFVRTATGFNPQILATVETDITQATTSAQTDVMVQNAFRRLQQGMRILLRYDMPGGFPEGDLHAIRIRSKETRYLVEIIQNCLSHRQDLGDLNARLYGVHQALGVWHDRQVALQRLTQFLDDHRKSRARIPQAYAAFTREIRDGKEAALRAFDSAWSQLVRLAGKSDVLNSGI